MNMESNGSSRERMEDKINDTRTVVIYSAETDSFIKGKVAFFQSAASEIHKVRLNDILSTSSKSTFPNDIHIPAGLSKVYLTDVLKYDALHATPRKLPDYSISSDEILFAFDKPGEFIGNEDHAKQYKSDVKNAIQNKKDLKQQRIYFLTEDISVEGSVDIVQKNFNDLFVALSKPIISFKNLPKESLEDIFKDNFGFLPTVVNVYFKRACSRLYREK